MGDASKTPMPPAAGAMERRRGFESCRGSRIGIILRPMPSRCVLPRQFGKRLFQAPVGLVARFTHRPCLRGHTLRKCQAESICIVG